MDKRIIVSTTSWPGRIVNVATVLKTILNQTKKPDLIEINLSLDEFPNREKDLPEDLQKLISDNKNIEINWEEENIYTFKKIIPTLKKFFGEDYYLVSIDDDLLYKENFIEKSINEMNRLKVNAFNFSSTLILGNRQVYNSTIFTPDFWDNLTQKIIDSKHDDGYIYYYLQYIKNEKFLCRPLRVSGMFEVFNPINSTSETTKYLPFREMHKLFE